MAGLLSALNANSIMHSNASSNVANLNTQDYQSIRTTLTADFQGNIEAVTTKNTTPGAPTGDGHCTSNVDLPQEFCDMIKSQRGFEAILSAISTREDMLNDLIDVLTEAE